ncbi:MAG: cell division suppressor protein YneA [Anaerovoracaceae bacterium]|jgi:cell division protein YceG involved in septum cleavage
MERRKNFRIKSKFRFIIFVVISLLIVCVGISTMMGFYNASGGTPQQYVKVKVSSGETLWDIAQKYTDNSSDVRETVFAIKNANDMETSDLATGQTIRIPVDK